MTTETRYRLEVRLDITKEECNDADRDYWRPTQERLGVNQTIDLGALDFLGVTRILAGLHDVVTGLRNGTAVDD